MSKLDGRTKEFIDLAIEDASEGDTIGVIERIGMLDTTDDCKNAYEVLGEVRKVLHDEIEQRES